MRRGESGSTGVGRQQQQQQRRMGSHGKRSCNPTALTIVLSSNSYSEPVKQMLPSEMNVSYHPLSVHPYLFIHLYLPGMLKFPKVIDFLSL